tara:strand:- start:165 stop:1337 length:1173 start_codon:yes stop_codon:yes gene_type:complete
MSTLKVDGIRSNSATSDAITLASDGTCTANITNNLSNRNLIINGAMNVAQRGTSSTSTGYQTVDRFYGDFSGTDEAPTFAQVNISSGTTPYTLGFRKALKITNGNQTSGAGTADKVLVYQRIEAQNVAQSGWNYTSSSSYITLSFWVKSSVAQNFYGYLRAPDGTAQNYPFETGSLSANTWTKVTKTIPGNSNLTIDNNNGYGLEFNIVPFWGTDNTGSVSLNTWAAFASATRMPDNTSTWYTTNDATFEITGVQLEVGSVATDFEHRSYGQEIALCGRYYQRLVDANYKALGVGVAYNGSTFQIVLEYPLGKMRTSPSIDAVTGADYWQVEGGSLDPAKHVDGSWVAEHSTDTQMSFYGVPDSTFSTLGLSHYLRSDHNDAKFSFSAEL